MLVIVGLVALLLAGCGAPHLDEAKRQYTMALHSNDPLPHYKAALEELDTALQRDATLAQAYAIKGLIYRNLDDFERATENLELAKQGSYEGQLRWVPTLINLTYGDVFHRQAGDAIRAGEWERAKSYQETALEFFDSVINTTFSSFEEAAPTTLGVSMQDLYIKAQGRWAAAKFQMAVIAGRLESKERQEELLREATNRLKSVVQSAPESTALRYYLAEGYRKYALTIRRSRPDESQELQEKAMSQLRACAELGLPSDLRNPAAQLVRVLSKGTEPELEQKILGTQSSQ